MNLENFLSEDIMTEPAEDAGVAPMLTAEMMIEAMKKMDEPIETGPLFGLIRCKWCNQYHVMKSMLEINPINTKVSVDQNVWMECANEAQSWEEIQRRGFTGDALIFKHGFDVPAWKPETIQVSMKVKAASMSRKYWQL